MKRRTGPNVCYGCRNTRNNAPGRHFFRFPTEPIRCQLWVRNGNFHELARHDSEYLNEKIRLCSDHFENSEFKNQTNLNSLNWDAVPTKFHFLDVGTYPSVEQVAAKSKEGESLPTRQRPHCASTDTPSHILTPTRSQTSEKSSEGKRPPAGQIEKCMLTPQSQDESSNKTKHKAEVWAEYWALKRRNDPDVSNGACQSLPSPEEVSMSGYEAWSKYKKDTGRRKDDNEPLSEVMETSLPRMEFSEAAALLQRLRNCEVFTWQNEEVTLQEDRPLGATGEMSSLCRLCASDVGQEMVQIFGTEGVKLRLSHKISRFLPVQVQLETDLPQQVCRECVNKLSVCDEVYRTWERAERTFRTIRRNKQANLNPDTSAEILARDNITVSRRSEEFSVPSPQSVEDMESDGIESEVLDCDMQSLEEVQECSQEMEKTLPQTDFFVLDMPSSLVVTPPLYCTVCEKGFRSLMMLSTHSFYTHRILMCGFCGDTGPYADKNELNKHHVDVCKSNNKSLRSEDRENFPWQFS